MPAATALSEDSAAAPTSTPPRPPGFEVTPPCSPIQAEALSTLPTSSPPPAAGASVGLDALFMQPEAAILPAPPALSRVQTARRKTLAGVTINSGPCFSLQRNTARAKDRRAAAPVSVQAERLVCRSLGIVQDGKDITKDALDELSRRFQHELSPAVLSALRALFKVDDEDATAIEDALINRGGQAALDHAAAEATADA